jgi:hypothetical protein
MAEASVVRERGGLTFSGRLGISTPSPDIGGSDVDPDLLSEVFPYGDKWAWGITITDSLVTIHNPVVQRAGTMMSDWFFSDAGAGITAKDSISKTLSGATWFDETGQPSKIIVAYRYDTFLNTAELIVTANRADACTLPTDDGAATQDALRYYLIPLYVLSSTVSTHADVELWFDIIHGLYQPYLMG